MLERLLFTLDDNVKSEISQKRPPMVVGEDTENVWPPWPWPPWGDDDDGDGDDEDNQDKRSPAERAHDLAKGVVKFESQVANASLDL